MRLRKVVYGLTLAFSVLVINGCKDEITDTKVYDKVLPEKNISYKADLQPLFDITCAISGCHDNSSAAGDLRLTSWYYTTKDPIIVLPERPDNSHLVLAVEGKLGGKSMPPYNQVPLKANHIKAIRQWVLEGAKNN